MPPARRAPHGRPGTRRPAPAGTVPLARALSKRGLASRAEAIDLILAGRVRVDGRVVRDPGLAVVPERLAVAIDDAPITAPAWRAIALYKPRGVVTTRRDPAGRPTVHDLVAPLGDGLAPAGRLDLASTGLLVCTNDTRLAAWLTDPATGVEKEYVVTVRGPLDTATVARLAEGVRDDGEWLRPRSMTLLKASARESQVAVVLTEGKNREIRRIFASAGRDVTRLLRVRIGGLTLGTLGPGAWRDIRQEKLADYFPEYSDGRSRRPRRTDPAR
ncbi:MAG: pseudouridine synthase [Vicinamibacterales bacterium]